MLYITLDEYLNYGNKYSLGDILLLRFKTRVFLYFKTLMDKSIY